MLSIDSLTAWFTTCCGYVQAINWLALQHVVLRRLDLIGQFDEMLWDNAVENKI